MDKIDKFIKDCTEIHNNQYNYSLVPKTFKSQRSMIDIICYEHGVFTQKAENHKKGQKCRKCRDKERSLSTRRTKEEFFNLLSKDKKDKYDYSLVKNYYNDSIETFICREHGEFNQTISRHIHTSGCLRCSRKTVGSKLKKVVYKKDIIEFINVNKFNLENSLTLIKPLKDSYFLEEEIEFNCLYHGEFKVSVRKLRRNTTCLKCRFKGHSKHEFVEFCLKTDRQKVTVYKILIFNEKESFIKIGITSLTVKKRFRKLKKESGYSYKTLKTRELSPAEAWDFEFKLKNLNRKHRITPFHNFAGYTECFKKIEYDF